MACEPLDHRGHRPVHVPVVVLNELYVQEHAKTKWEYLQQAMTACMMYKVIIAMDDFD